MSRIVEKGKTQICFPAQRELLILFLFFSQIAGVASIVLISELNQYIQALAFPVSSILIIGGLFKFLSVYLQIYQLNK